MMPYRSGLEMASRMRLDGSLSRGGFSNVCMAVLPVASCATEEYKVTFSVLDSRNCNLVAPHRPGWGGA